MTPTEGKPEALLRAGAQLANIAFNWAQRPGYTLTADDVAMLDQCRRQWDEARAAFRAELEALRLAARRYETVRRLSLREFGDLWQRAPGGERFDELVDAASGRPSEGSPT